MNEFEIINKLGDYFVNLGYEEAMFEKEANLSSQSMRMSRVDFIINVNGAPHIIVEVKRGRSLDKVNIDDLKYDPSVRQVQMYAAQLNAPIYIVTNGNDFLWFETDKSGRPQKIEPVFYNNNSNANADLDLTIVDALNICSQILKVDAMSSDYIHELTLILLARFAVNNTVSSQNIPYEINRILENEYSFDISLTSRVSEKTLQNCWFELSQCKPETANKNQLLMALKLLIQKNKSYYSYKVTDKLSELLINLAKPKAGQIILDPSANLGEIITAMASNENSPQIYSYCQSVEQYAFLSLMNLILFNDPYRAHLMTFQDYTINSFETKCNQCYDIIISAFPFGSRIGNFDEVRYRAPIELIYAEDYMLLASLENLKVNGRLVAIVPESMLFSGGKRTQLRRYIVEKYYIRAIISLPVGAISNSNAKTSIVVIDKSKKADDSVFFGIVQSTDFNADRLFLDDNNNSVDLLKAYEDYLKYSFIDKEDYWKSTSVSVNVENLRADAFLSINEVLVGSPYPHYAINDICSSIKRGSSIKNDDQGTIPFAGPAAIRANKFDENKLSFTSEEKMKSNTLYVSKGSVLFNNISSHLGEATFYEGAHPLAINQHIISLTVRKEKVLPQYLAIALNSKEVNNNIIRMSTGVTIPSITVENIKNILIPIPDIETQQKIVNSVNRIQDEIRQIEYKKKELEKRLTTIINTLEPEEV